MTDDTHYGGCSCGAVRFETQGEPFYAGVCHCRYCQTRTGSAFGVSIYFDDDRLKINQGELTEYLYNTESGGTVTIRFCKKCGTTVFWKASVNEGRTAVAGGAFDPPSFWYEIEREIFCRSKAPFVSNAIGEKYESHPNYNPIREEKPALKGESP